MTEEMNAVPEPKESHIIQVSAGEKLQEIVERIEELEEQKAEIASSIKDTYAEAKCEGFDPKILRQVVRMRKMEQQEIEEQQSLLHLYLQALGMQAPATRTQP